MLFGQHPAGVAAGDWESVLQRATPFTCAPGMALREVLRGMASSRRHRCWVVEDGRPVGVITCTDILHRVVQ